MYGLRRGSFSRPSDDGGVYERRRFNNLGQAPRSAPRLVLGRGPMPGGSLSVTLARSMLNTVNIAWLPGTCQEVPPIAETFSGDRLRAQGCARRSCPDAGVTSRGGR